MAAGDVTWFVQAKQDLGLKRHDIDNDVIKFALCLDPTGLGTPFTMSATLSDPRWGSGGGTNVSSAHVVTGGNYTAPYTVSTTWDISGTSVVFDHPDVVINPNPSNPTAARWGVYYNDTDAGKRCLAYVDLGSALSTTSGFVWSPSNSGVMTLT